jgi:hypothetical protein
VGLVFWGKGMELTPWKSVPSVVMVVHSANSNP